LIYLEVISMNFNKIVVVATVVCLIVLTSNTRAISATNIINLGQSTNFLKNDNSFIQPKKEILQISDSNLINSKFDNKALSLCKINQRSISEDWINLLGKLIILGSFGSVGVMSNSVVIQRYVKLIFKDILPIFVIIFLSLSLLGIASVIAAISFPSSAPSTSSVSSQNNCILK